MFYEEDILNLLNVISIAILYSPSFVSDFEQFIDFRLKKNLKLIIVIKIPGFKFLRIKDYFFIILMRLFNVLLRLIYFFYFIFGIYFFYKYFVSLLIMWCPSWDRYYVYDGDALDSYIRWFYEPSRRQSYVIIEFICDVICTIFNREALIKTYTLFFIAVENLFFNFIIRDAIFLGLMDLVSIQNIYEISFEFIFSSLMSFWFLVEYIILFNINLIIDFLNFFENIKLKDFIEEIKILQKKFEDYSFIIEFQAFLSYIKNKLLSFYEIIKFVFYIILDLIKIIYNYVKN